GPDGLEQSAAHLVSSEPHSLGNGPAVPFGGQDLFRVSTDEKIADNAGALHAGERFNLFERPVVKVRLPRSALGRARKLHPKDPFGLESRIDILYTPEASDQQTSAGQQNDRQREFRHYQSAADSTRSHPTRDSSSSLLAGGPEVSTRHRYSRRESNQD